MKADTILDYAVFQLSPKHSRCELFISSDGNTEKLASGLVKPFVTHLKVAEEQVARSAQSVRLEVGKRDNAETWFTKGTLERFVRFVSTPEVLELVNTFDVEMSQLEAAQKIYSQGTWDPLCSAIGGDGTGTMGAADETKKELLRAIDVRLVAVKQDLTTAYARAVSAGFSPETVPELRHFANRFGAHRLNEACTKFTSVCRRRPDLISPWKPTVNDQVVRSSCGSDMSIDDHPEKQSGPHQLSQNEHLKLSIASTCQHPKSIFPAPQQQQADNEDDGEGKEEAVMEPTTSQPARRLSVQDRIKLFESNQKDNTSGSGGKPVGKSAELKRLSSDVSPLSVNTPQNGPPEKAVLRRWSGVSDMSIDLGNERKENSNTENSDLCTPSSPFVSLPKSNVFSEDNNDQKDKRELNDSLSLVKVEDKSGGNREEDDSGVKLKASLGGEKSDKFKVEGRFQENVGVKSQVTSQTHIGNSVSRAGDLNSGGEIGNKAEDVEQTDQFVVQSHFQVPHSHLRSLSGQFQGYQSISQPQWRSLTGEVEKTGKDLPPSGKESINMEDSGSQRMKFQKPFTGGPELVKKMPVMREETSFVHGNNKPVFSGNKAAGSQESFSSILAPQSEQVQRSRQSKGNQEVNDELKVKANELEKLFTEHKLRVPGDQSSSTRRSKPTEPQMETTAISQCRKPTVSDISPLQLSDKNTVMEPSGSSSNAAKFSTPPMKMEEKQDFGDSVRPNFSELGFSDDLRGKFYERYMQKRDAKLREEWSFKRTEKEAKLKAMQDNLERSRAEMKAKLSGFLDRQDSVSTARRRGENVRSFNFRLSVKTEQHPISSIQSKEDEDLSEIFDQKYRGQDRSFSEMSSGDNASRSSQVKKLLPNRKFSSTPRTAAVPIPRSSAKVSSAVSGRRRLQSENPLAHSVPNFSDIRKENTKPSSGVGKVTAHSQVGNYARSKSSNEEIPLVKEENPMRSTTLQKSSGGSVEFSDMTVLNSNSVALAPLKFDKEQTVQSLHDEYLQGVESKPFLRKGNGIGPGSGASIAKLRASFTAETLRNEEYDELVFEAEDSADMTKEDEEDELETMDVGDCTGMDKGKPRFSQDSEKVGNCGSENCDSMRSLSQADPGSAAELPATVPSTFHAVGSLQDSPGESPGSWNSSLHRPFSYPHEMLDIDGSVDSPIGSPASWNSHSLNKTEADAAWMRKKWGSAQKPFLASNPSHTQSRKDTTKGFKRLLIFGRKNRGTESLADWISATTSEGDDDTEDVRDPGNRSSEDLRKPRMGFSQSNPSDDGYNESELFTEQVHGLHSSIPAPPANFKLTEHHMSGSSMKAPRSFFSLSTFRSKGSDLKPR